MKLDKLNWGKMSGLIPAIIQDAKTYSVLMLGYMNEAALQNTIQTKCVTFFSRSKNRLWMKGETSGNKLELISILPDCDNDTLLILANPTGPICHKGYSNCFNDFTPNDKDFIYTLEKIIYERAQSHSKNSYTVSLLNAGLNEIAQKIGEEAVEVVIAALEESDFNLIEEVSDLLFHILVLLRKKNIDYSNIMSVLKMRMLNQKDHINRI